MVTAGFEATVAPLGTALTVDQLALMWRLADEPILCFDGDDAGRRAAYRAIDVALPLLKPGKSLKFASLPDGQDPDQGGHHQLADQDQQEDGVEEALGVRGVQGPDTAQSREAFDGQTPDNLNDGRWIAHRCASLTAVLANPTLLTAYRDGVQSEVKMETQPVTRSSCS